MPEKILTDVDMFDEIISAMYNGGKDKQINLKEFVKQKGWEFNGDLIFKRFCQELNNTGWVTLYINYDCILNDTGLGYMKMYGVYSVAIFKIGEWGMNKAEKEYNENKRKERKKATKETFEYVIKNTGSIVAIILSLSTVLVTIISLIDKRELRSLEQEVKQLKTAQDTLIQKLNLPQKPQNTSPLKKDSISK